MKKLLIYSACALLALGASSCHGDDPLVEGTTQAIKTTKTVSGVVYDEQGNPVSGATVTLGDRTTTTDANGRYTFDNVPSGENTITVSKDGKETIGKTVDVQDTENTYNGAESFVLFPSEDSQKIGNNSTATVNTTTLSFNPTAKTSVTVTTEDGSLPEDVKIWITPIYSEESDNVTRAASEKFLLGATVHTSKPITLTKDVEISFDLDPSVTAVALYKELQNDAWVTVTPAVDNGKVTIKTRHITSFGIYAPLEVSTNLTSKSVVFDKDYFNNFNGTSPMALGSVNYNYLAGSTILTTPANKLQALMIEWVGRNFGFKQQSLDGKYKLDTELNPGFALQVFGKEFKEDFTVTCNGTNTVNGTHNRGVELWNQLFKSPADHNGGGSK